MLGAGADNDTAKFACTLPSVTVTFPIVTVGAVSSSVIVPTPCVSPATVTFVPLFRLTVKLSVGSGTAFPTVAIEIVPLV